MNARQAMGPIGVLLVLGVCVWFGDSKGPRYGGPAAHREVPEVADGVGSAEKVGESSVRHPPEFNEWWGANANYLDWRPGMIVVLASGAGYYRICGCAPVGSRGPELTAKVVSVETREDVGVYYGTVGDGLGPNGCAPGRWVQLDLVVRSFGREPQPGETEIPAEFSLISQDKQGKPVTVWRGVHMVEPSTELLGPF